MDDEIYRAPTAELEVQPTSEERQFYVVSPLKLSVLYLGTVGMYTVYWFYKNWQFYRRSSGERVLPAARAIFFIFFVTSLFRTVDATIRRNGISHVWRPNLLAALYVALYIFSTVCEKLSDKDVGSPVTDILWLLTFPCMLAVLLRGQAAINASQRDPQGSSNKQFTIYNILWLVGIWSLVIFAFATGSI